MTRAVGLLLTNTVKISDDQRKLQESYMKQMKNKMLVRIIGEFVTVPL